MASSIFRKLPKQLRLSIYRITAPLSAKSSEFLDPSTRTLRFVLSNFDPRVRVSFFSSTPLLFDEAQGPAAISYSSILAEDEFHKLADETLHDLQEKFEEYGDKVQIDGFDIDYGNHVLTLKLGNIGTYVINKQTPNRQIWLSSPVSGPSRFDWDATTKGWIYRRTNANLLQLLEEEAAQLCDKQISLS